MGLCLVRVALASSYVWWVATFELDFELSRRILNMLPWLAAFLVTCLSGHRPWLSTVTMIALITIVGVIKNLLMGEGAARQTFLAPAAFHSSSPALPFSRL